MKGTNYASIRKYLGFGIVVGVIVLLLLDQFVGFNKGRNVDVKNEKAATVVTKPTTLTNEELYNQAITHIEMEDYSFASSNLDKINRDLVTDSVFLQKFDSVSNIVAVELLKKARKENPLSDISTHQPQSSPGTFTITHILGKRLPKAATFSMTSSGFELDYNNEKSIFYTVLSGNSTNALCNIKTIDSNGDRCRICVTPGSNRSATIEFEYAAGTLVMEGYYN